MSETQPINDSGDVLAVEADIKLCGGKYELEKVLGKGGFGITYLGRHIGLDKPVAIKEYFPKDVFRRMENGTQVSYSNKSASRKNIDRFLKEARTMAQLKHEGIVRVTDVFQENGTVYYIMDYVEGESLENKESMSETTALEYVRQVADALKYIHSRNILHMDIKPANIMLNSENKAVLIDFGISKHYDAQGCIESSTVVGYSAGYSPVEQMTPGGLSFFSPATDIYALGATIYRIVSGKKPPASTLLAGGEVLTKPAAMSEELFAVVKRCMKINKYERPQSIDEFLTLLDGMEPPNPQPKPKPKPKPQPNVYVVTDDDDGKRKKLQKYILRGVAAVVLFVVIVLSYDKCSSQGETETVTETATKELVGLDMDSANTLTPQYQEEPMDRQAELKAKEEQRTKVEKERRRAEEKQRIKEKEAQERAKREENFKKYKNLGDAYWTSYKNSRFQDTQAKNKAKQYYEQALQNKEDATIRTKYNSLVK